MVILATIKMRGAGKPSSVVTLKNNPAGLSEVTDLHALSDVNMNGFADGGILVYDSMTEEFILQAAIDGGLF